MIESSFAMQYPQKDVYGEDMDFKEFMTLLNGLTADTPLGRIIQIRSEENKEMISHFTAGEKKIHDDWQRKMVNLQYKGKSKEEVMKDISNMFRSMFS